jgi:hypothetical protein
VTPTTAAQAAETLQLAASQRAQRQPAAARTAAPARSPTAREARKGWAALIRQVYKSDPLACPNCGAAMKIITLCAVCDFVE